MYPLHKSRFLPEVLPEGALRFLSRVHREQKIKGSVEMAREIPCDRCVKTEGNFGPAGVYVIVSVRDGCPVDVQASLVPRVQMVPPEEIRTMRGKLQNLVDLSNEVLQIPGANVSTLIKFMMRPPSGMSRVIGLALIAALEE